MMAGFKRLESFLKSISGIITAICSILGVLIAIFVAVVRLNTTVTNIVTMLPLVQEHSIFISYQVDDLISECFRQIANHEEVTRQNIAKLLLYRDTLPKTLTYKQIMDINYIEGQTIYR